MDDRSSPTTCRVGMIAAAAVALLGVAYAAVLVPGFLSLGAPDQPIGDPWFAVLELLIVAMMPAMVVLMAVIHIRTPGRLNAFSLISLIFMSMTAALTIGVHFTVLVLGRLPQFSGASWTPLLSFQWPSLPYVLDILAWDLFFPLSMLFAAPVFGGNRLQDTIRLLMIASGLLALAGLSGPITGDMRLRNIGILGYAGAFLLVAALLAVFFRCEELSEGQT